MFLLEESLFILAFTYVVLIFFTFWVDIDVTASRYFLQANICFIDSPNGEKLNAWFNWFATHRGDLTRN